jgi:hypothetical protein
MAPRLHGEQAGFESRMARTAGELLVPLMCVGKGSVRLIGVVRQVAEAATNVRAEVVILSDLCHAQRSLEMLSGK